MRNFLDSDTTDAGRLRTLSRIARGLSERPQAFGVAPEDAADFLKLVETAEAAFARAEDRLTRTSLDVSAKRQTLTQAEKASRVLVRFIRVNPRVSEADLEALGIRPAAERRRVPPPQTRPILTLEGIVPGGHDISVCDESTPDRRGKPRDVAALELFVAYTHGNDSRPLDIEDLLKTATPLARLTRYRGRTQHPAEKIGWTANYIGRWVNGRGEPGPWSRPVRMALALPAETTTRQAA